MKPKTFLDPRLLAAQAVSQVIYFGRSLNAVLAERHYSRVHPGAKGLLRELVFGTLRWHLRLDGFARRLLQKPLREGEYLVHCLLLVGLYQLLYLRIPTHAAVAETVMAAKRSGKAWAAGLINAILRNCIQQRDRLTTDIDQQEEQRYAHPQWLLDMLEQAWPEHLTAILQANNQQAPMTLRVNRLRCDRENYLQMLQAKGKIAMALPFVDSAIQMVKPCDVAELPNFSEGFVSVQDAAGQFAAFLLDLQPGQRVLDTCAAPGGKTTHILETESQLAQVVAVDTDQARLVKLQSNLQRLGLIERCQVVCGDASTPHTWWDGQLFDRILLDAPCTATGVIRRHPDIKILRRASDIPSLIATQQQLLEAAWPMLKPGGVLLYATCSLLPMENQQQIARFLAMHTDAEEVALKFPGEAVADVGWQLLPGFDGMDGFYYAKLMKLNV